MHCAPLHPDVNQSIWMWWFFKSSGIPNSSNNFGLAISSFKRKIYRKSIFQQIHIHLFIRTNEFEGTFQTFYKFFKGNLTDVFVKATHRIKGMTDYIKEPHTTIFTSPMDCGKTQLLLDLIEKEYDKHFDYIIIIQHFNGIRHIIPRTGSKMIINFGL